MDMRSETGILSSREPFTVNLQKSPIQQTQPSMQNMRLAFAPDGTTIYKQVSATSPPPPPFPGSGGGGNNPTGESGEGADAQPIASHGMNVGVGEPVKRKRGRPRKYGPDGTMALGLSPGSALQASGGLASPTNSASAEGKKARGRPLGSGKKQQMTALGSAGIGFTPHVITVKAGEDVSSKIMSFLQVGPRAVCILSANGAISNVTLRQASMSGGTVTYEGRFEILSLSGSFLFSESGGHRSRTGGLSVSLAGPDGRVLGGGVAGLLTAASPIQVVVGSFMSDGKKELKKPAPLEPLPSGKLPPVGGMGRAASPTSHGTMSESSGGAGSPTNQSAGGCSNGNQQGISNMPWK